jgi:capsular polysaccharide biosynthesis protein
MTSISLHPAPRWRTVAAEQLRAVGLLTRSSGIALIVLLLVGFAIVVSASVQARDLGRRHVGIPTVTVVFAPSMSVAFAIVAVLYAFLARQDDDPTRPSYYWMMPVDPQVHTFTRVLAGWVWILAATALCLLTFAPIGAVSSLITGHPQPVSGFPWWVWIVPFTSATIAYVLASSVMVGTGRPLLWVAGIIAVYGGMLLALDWLGYRDAYRIVRTAFNGEYGVVAAVAGQIDRLDTAHLQLMPSVERWLVASALWGGLGVLLLVALSRRQAEPSWVGEGPPPDGRRAAIMRHKWLIASVGAITVACGVFATRFVKPEYEARATIWLAPQGRPSGLVPSFRLMNADSYIDILRSSRIADTVVRKLALYVRPDEEADTSLLRGFSLASRFIPAQYHLAVDDRGSRWRLWLDDVAASDSGAVGDSVGRLMGLRWRPDSAMLAKRAGSEVGFFVNTPKLTKLELLARMTALQPANSSFLQLALTDPDPTRAAGALNAISAEYVAKMREAKGVDVTVLDSAVAPTVPFKNSPSQLLGVSLLIAVVAVIGLALMMNTLEEQMRRLREFVAD